MVVVLKRMIVSLPVVWFISLVIILPEVQAVESWNGNSWEGDSWEGDSWEGSPWEGDPWKGDSIDSEQNVEDTNGNISEESIADEEMDNSSEEKLEKQCLPGEGGCEGVRQTMDLSTDDRIDEAVEQFAKDHPYMFVPNTPFNQELREDQMDRIKQEFTRLLERPHGTVQEIDIPDNILATLAESGYSDEHLGSSKEEKDNFLEANNWNEIESYSKDFIGLDTRTYEHALEDKIVISFGGTEKNGLLDLSDIGTDINLAFGWDVKQFEAAVEYVREMMEANPDKEIVLTGHSLGGGIAQYVALNTGIPAVTFSAPGIDTREQSIFENPLTIVTNDGNMLPVEKYLNEYGLLNDLVENHIMEDDIVGNYQIHAGTTYSYSNDGTVTCRDDYSEVAHNNDSLKNKYDQLKRNKERNFSDHSMKRYFEIMIEC